MKYCQIDKEGMLSVQFKNKTAKFSDWRHNGDIHGIFITKDYSELPIKNSIVVDAGANIGDSSIYFALCGAKKIISIEPVEINYQSQKNNVKLNNLENISMRKAILSETSGEIIIDKNNLTTGHIKECSIDESGEIVEKITLEDIVHQYKIDSGILKMDIEGYEYGIIRSSNPKILLKFHHIIIELHGEEIELINEMKDKLEQIGFDIKISTVTSTYGTSTFLNAKK